MLRRRRSGSSEIAFSFDSFLDLVANVVGVILRLILVAWVGAKTYTGVFAPPGSQTEHDPEPVAALPAESPQPELRSDTERAELERAKRQLADVRATLLDQLRQQEAVRGQRLALDRQRADLTGNLHETRKQLDAVEVSRREVALEQARVELSLQEIRRRTAELRKELEALRARPVEKKVLRYQTPVARTVQSEELHFECKDGRVTFLDVEALMREIRQGLHGKGERLRSQFDLHEETAPVGAFRLRYVIARERGLMDGVGGAASPIEKDNFRFGLESWEAIPVQSIRGESTDQALATGSEFRNLVDHLDATQTAVTFWVYPDSFSLYRQLRDHCLRRDLLVAGRPLPDGLPIASSRQGSASRGQ